MEKSKLYVMCGIPGSGKTTFIKNNNFASYTSIKIVSRDAVRFSIIDEHDEYFSKERLVWKAFIEEIKDGLKKYHITIADATHIDKASRAKLLNALQGELENVEVIAWAIDVDLNTALLRNANREGRELVPEDAIRRMYFKYTIPKEEEGFDRVIIVDNN